MATKTFTEVSVLWKMEKMHSVKRSTYATYVNHLNKHILPFLGDKSFISETDVRHLLENRIDSGVSRSTIRDVMVVLRMVLQYGVHLKAWPESHWNIRYPSGPHHPEVMVLPKEKHAQLLDAASADLRGEKMAIFLSLTTGIRIGEACALQWKDIDVERGLLSISKTLERVYISDTGGSRTELIIGPPKTLSSIRDIPLIPEVLSILSPLTKGKKKDNYVLSDSPSPMEPSTCRNRYRQFLNEQGIQYVKFHCLRHSFATRCIESGCDTKTLSTILGHSNIGTTMNIYMHPGYEQKIKCLERMNSFIKKNR